MTLILYGRGGGGGGVGVGVMVGVPLRHQAIGITLLSTM